MEKELVVNNKIVNNIFIIFWVFIIGSVFGFFAEIIYSIIYTHTIKVMRGLIYGPFIQIYGIGAVAFYILVSKVKNVKQAFFIGMLMGGSLEYLCSFFQELVFGTISWDYSKQFLNMNGRTCLLYCIYWGIIAIIFFKIVNPSLKEIEYIVNNKKVKVVTVFLMVFMIFDITISCMAGTRQKERRNYLPAESKVDHFLDKYYPDEVLNKIYNNKKDIN